MHKGNSTCKYTDICKGNCTRPKQNQWQRHTTMAPSGLIGAFVATSTGSSSEDSTSIGLAAPGGAASSQQKLTIIINMTYT